MIDRRIVKFKLRRGTEDQRKTVVFEEGEMVYVTDTKKVYVGDGRLSGGSLLSNNIYNLSGMPAAYTENDLVYRTDFGLLYIATSNPVDPFVFTGPYADTTTITFSANKLCLALSGIGPKHLSTTVAGSGLALNLSGLYINYDPSKLAITDGRLTILPNSLLSGITVAPGGGLSDTITGVTVVVDNKTLEISPQIGGNDLHVKQVSAQHIAPSSINVTKLSADVVAPLSGVVLATDGLAINYDNTLKLTGGKLAVNNSLFTYQTGLTGYQLLQNGFIMQWGVLSGVNLNETFITATFPTAFTQCYNVQATLSLANPVAGSITPIIKNITNTTVSIGTDLGFNTIPTTGNIYWTAIGYQV